MELCARDTGPKFFARIWPNFSEKLPLSESAVMTRRNTPQTLIRRLAFPDSVSRAVVTPIHGVGALAMADCSMLSDGKRALTEGAEIIGTTLSGYTDETATDDPGPDLDLIRQFRALGGFTMAEGRLNTPALVTQAMRAGADAVTVGTALTRLEVMTGWFRDAVRAGKE